MGGMVWEMGRIERRGRGKGDECCIEKVTLTVIVVHLGEISLLILSAQLTAKTVYANITLYVCLGCQL